VSKRCVGSLAIQRRNKDKNTQGMRKRNQNFVINMAIKPRIVLEKQIFKPGIGDLFSLKKVNAIQNIT
jgi:hypothetical protein